VVAAIWQKVGGGQIALIWTRWNAQRHCVSKKSVNL